MPFLGLVNTVLSAASRGASGETVVTLATDVWSTKYDGSNDYAVVADSDDFSFGDASTDSAFSVEFYIKPPVAGSTVYILSKYNGASDKEYTIFLNTTNKVSFKLFDLDNSNYILATADAGLTAGEWAHVIVTYDGGASTPKQNGLTIYVDGVAVAQTVSTGGTYVAMHNTAGSLYFGSLDGSTAFGDCLLNHVTFWGTEIDSANASAIYNAGVPINPESNGGNYDQAANLVEHWNMEDTDTTTFNGVNGHNATMTGAEFDADVPNISLPTWANTQSVYFDDTDDYIDCLNFNPTTEIGSGDFTVSLWFRLDSVAGYDTLFSWTNSSVSNEICFRAQFITGLGVRMVFRDDSGAFRNTYSGASIAINTWYHLLVTRSGTTANIYINNANNSSDTDSNVGVDFTGLDHHALGLYANGGTPNMGGYISEYAVFDRVISSGERAELYNSGTPIDARTVTGADPVLYLPLEGDTGRTALDYSGNLNHGILVNDATWSSENP